MTKGEGKIMRVSNELAEMANKIHELNDISVKQATKEIVEMAKSNSIDKKIIREIKF